MRVRVIRALPAKCPAEKVLGEIAGRVIGAAGNAPFPQRVGDAGMKAQELSWRKCREVDVRAHHGIHGELPRGFP